MNVFAVPWHASTSEIHPMSDESMKQRMDQHQQYPAQSYNATESPAAAAPSSTSPPPPPPSVQLMRHNPYILGGSSSSYENANSLKANNSKNAPRPSACALVAPKSVDAFFDEFDNADTEASDDMNRNCAREAVAMTMTTPSSTIVSEACVSYQMDSAAMAAAPPRQPSPSSEWLPQFLPSDTHCVSGYDLRNLRQISEQPEPLMMMSRDHNSNCHSMMPYTSPQLRQGYVNNNNNNNTNTTNTTTTRPKKNTGYQQQQQHRHTTAQDGRKNATLTPMSEQQHHVLRADNNASSISSSSPTPPAPVSAGGEAKLSYAGALLSQRVASKSGGGGEYAGGPNAYTIPLPRSKQGCASPSLMGSPEPQTSTGLSVSQSVSVSSGRTSTTPVEDHNSPGCMVAATTAVSITFTSVEVTASAVISDEAEEASISTSISNISNAPTPTTAANAGRSNKSTTPQENAKPQRPSKKSGEWHTVTGGKQSDCTASFPLRSSSKPSPVVSIADVNIFDVLQSSKVKATATTSTSTTATKNKRSTPAAAATSATTKNSTPATATTMSSTKKSNASHRGGENQPQARSKAEKDCSDDNLSATAASEVRENTKRRQPAAAMTTSEEMALLDSVITSCQQQQHGSPNSLTTTTTATVVASTAASASTAAAAVSLLNIPLTSIKSANTFLSDGTSSYVSPHHRALLSLLQRVLRLGDSPSAKALLLQRALSDLTDSDSRQHPMLACSLLLEASDCFIELERSLQCCHQALHLAEAHSLELFEMLSRLAITRTLARVIDTTDALTHLTEACKLAIKLGEQPALGWIVLQVGITLELSGLFSESLLWYAAGEAIARDTQQPRLLCDVLCCQSIALYAVGEMDQAEAAHKASTAALEALPRAWRQRPLQNFVQLKLQSGDVAGALSIHTEELRIAKEQNDNMAVSRCIGSIALAKKYLGLHNEAAAAYLEELSTYQPPDVRQAVESLTGAASCYLLSGNPKRARDCCAKAVKQARQCAEQCTLAKALLELAEVDMYHYNNSSSSSNINNAAVVDGDDEDAEKRMHYLQTARDHVVEALDAMGRVDATERKQYLVKATLCELEWRCCSTMQRVSFSSFKEKQNQADMWASLQYSDVCNVPNTANTNDLLRRRRRLYGWEEKCASTATSSSSSPATTYLSKDLLDEALLIDLLESPSMHGRKIVCYSLPWTEESVCMAFVVSLAAQAKDGTQKPKLHIVGYPLALPVEIISLMVSTSALSSLFDAPMYTIGDDNDNNKERLYGDIPLWPQHYSKLAFDFANDGSNGSNASRIATDPMYCLQALYRAFIAPIQHELQHNMSGGQDDVRGLTFVADGVFSRIPFHALHDATTNTFLVESYSISTCSSLALLCMLHLAAKKQDAMRSTAADDNAEAAVSSSSSSSVVVSVEAMRRLWCGASASSTSSSSLPRQCVCIDEAHDEHSNTTTTTTATADDSAALGPLLRRLHQQSRDTQLSNALYAAAHSGSAGSVLELQVPTRPEVREDYCGSFSASRPHVSLVSAHDVAHGWNLMLYRLVLCSGCGTFGGLSIHETGVPVYRALQYAGAVRLLLPMGSKLVAPNHRVAAAATAATAKRSASIAEAIQAEQIRCIKDGVALSEWAAYNLCGLP